MAKKRVKVKRRRRRSASNSKTASKTKSRSKSRSKTGSKSRATTSRSRASSFSGSVSKTKSSDGGESRSSKSKSKSKSKSRSRSRAPNDRVRQRVPAKSSVYGYFDRQSVDSLGRRSVRMQLWLGITLVICFASFITAILGVAFDTTIAWVFAPFLAAVAACLGLALARSRNHLVLFGWCLLWSALTVMAGVAIFILIFDYSLFMVQVPPVVGSADDPLPAEGLVMFLYTLNTVVLVAVLVAMIVTNFQAWAYQEALYVERHLNSKVEIEDAFGMGWRA